MKIHLFLVVLYLVMAYYMAEKQEISKAIEIEWQLHKAVAMPSLGNNTTLMRATDGLSTPFAHP